jgi:hypothetical protein
MSDQTNANDNLEQRAIAAEVAATQLQTKIDELTKTLGQAREAIDASERRRQIDLELQQSETIDMETARLLTETAVARMKQPDIAKAVADLKKHKPFLFRPARKPASAMSATGKPAPVDELSQIAEEARQTGDKRALLKYLRARRT